MLRVVMTAAHAGWGSEIVPVGGGGAVCERLCQAWRDVPGLDLHVFGTGPMAPPAVAYRRLAPPASDVAPTRLSELAYARLCRAFERACTEAILELAKDGQEPLVVVAHDISEGPDFRRLHAAGVPLILLVHVDVVEYFTRMYLRNVVAPERLVRWFAALRRLPVPDVLRLVFDKQYDAAWFCDRIVVPSSSMATVLARCYPQAPDREARVVTVPWGAPSTPPPAAVDVDAARQTLRAAWGVQDGERILLTLSRVSPEKGQDRLLDAVRVAEQSGAPMPPLRIVICGGAAFMQGVSFMRRLQRQAARLRTPVVFAGHLDGARKRAALEMADVFVAASRHESYGLTTMEAFAAGAPVVAVDSHGARATVDDTCGRRVEAGAHLPRRLWQAVASLLHDEPLRARLGAGAAAKAQASTFDDAAATLHRLVLDVAR